MARKKLLGYRIALVSETREKQDVNWNVEKSIPFGTDWDLDELKWYMQALDAMIDEHELPYETAVYHALNVLRREQVKEPRKVPQVIRVPQICREWIRRDRKEEAERKRKEETEIEKFAREHKAVNRNARSKPSRAA